MRYKIQNKNIHHSLFDTVWYCENSGLKFHSNNAAFLNYIDEGWKNFFSPIKLFDPLYYCSQRNDLRSNLVNPFIHWISTGWRESLNPHPAFDTSFYINQFDDFCRHGTDPLSHYLMAGWKSGFKPNALFDPQWYLATHADVAKADKEPLTHFIEAGLTEGRQAFPGHIGGKPFWRAVPEVDENLTWAADVDHDQNYPSLTSNLTPSGVDIWSLEMMSELPSTNLVENVPRIGVFIHVFYEDLIDELCHELLKIPYDIHVYVTTDTEAKRRGIQAFLLRYGFQESQFDICIVENRGFDIGPMLTVFGEQIEKHDICLKLHTKKSTHNAAEFGSSWRRHLLDQNLASPARVRSIVTMLAKNPELGILVPVHWENLAGWVGIGENYAQMRGLLSGIDTQLVENQRIEYPSGSMFWFRGRALKALLAQKINIEMFESNTQRDGTLAHAIERSLLFFVGKTGMKWARLPVLSKLLAPSTAATEKIIRESGLFDAAYYEQTYPDVVRDRVDPISHYVQWGGEEGRNPAPWFDTKYYARSMRSHTRTRMNPLAHYVLHGKALNLPTKRPERVPATVQVDDLYAAYRKAEAGAEYVGETFPIIRKSDLKPLAFYFPQFHPFEENNRFWGRGFTEWTNTTKTVPMFAGHYQPRLPGELGFYDTRLKEVLQRQIELARQYGLHGFCFHHYFFSGMPVMRAPFNLMMANPDLDIPFCLHWANEPWTVRWDGLASQSGVLLAQSHSPEDDVAFFRDIEPALRDRRYITVDGRPLLVIYRPSLFPDMRATIERWQKLCRASGIKDLYLVVMHTGFEGPVDPGKYGFNAAIEYPPHHLGVAPVNERLSWFDPSYEGNAYDYAETIEKAVSRKLPKYKLFRGIMPEWDCTPRRRNPDLFVNCAPHRYQNWLTEIGRQTVSRFAPEEQFIFINAWNEWAEGAYLEPDRRFGYAYLSATAAAINEVPKGLTVSGNKPRILLGAHIFYVDLIDEFIAEFKKMPCTYDLVVTTREDEKDRVQAILEAELGTIAGTITVLGVPNLGRDFAPFVFEYLPRTADYDLCCWVHSKKSPYEPAYGTWRGYLLGNLFGSTAQVSAIIEAFDSNASLGLMFPKPFPAVANKVEWGSNFELTKSLLARLDIAVSVEDQPEFPTAAMFWFRPDALAGLLKLGLTHADFEAHAEGPRDPKTGSIVDGTISHALERMILYVTRNAGFTYREMSFLP